jgi:hypothetical protein
MRENEMRKNPGRWTRHQTWISRNTDLVATTGKTSFSDGGRLRVAANGPWETVRAYFPESRNGRQGYRVEQLTRFRPAPADPRLTKSRTAFAQALSTINAEAHTERSKSDLLSHALKDIDTGAEFSLAHRVVQMLISDSASRQTPKSNWRMVRDTAMELRPTASDLYRQGIRGMVEGLGDKYASFGKPLSTSTALEPLESKMHDGVAHVKLSNFYEGAADEVLLQLDSFEEQANAHQKKLQGLVLDLRDNEGGLVDEASMLLESLLDGGKVFTTVHRTHVEDHWAPRHIRRFPCDLPIVVLVNGNTRSAGEIVAGALQARQRATIMGSTTFGKGVGQSCLSLADKTSIQFTSFAIELPNGLRYHDKGITPCISFLEAGTQERDDSPESDILLDEALRRLRQSVV